MRGPLQCQGYGCGACCNEEAPLPCTGKRSVSATHGCEAAIAAVYGLQPHTGELSMVATAMKPQGFILHKGNDHAQGLKTSGVRAIAARRQGPSLHQRDCLGLQEPLMKHRARLSQGHGQGLGQAHGLGTLSLICTTQTHLRGSHSPRGWHHKPLPAACTLRPARQARPLHASPRYARASPAHRPAAQPRPHLEQERGGAAHKALPGHDLQVLKLDVRGLRRPA